MIEPSKKWIEKAGENPTIIAAACDLNGIWRGKRIPPNHFQKVLDQGIRIPLSASCVDVWGSDLIESPFLFQSGDSDGDGRPTGRFLMPNYPNNRHSALLPIWIFDNSGKGSPIDPRHVLNHIIKEFSKLNLRPVVAFELEFYLLPSSKILS